MEDRAHFSLEFQRILRTIWFLFLVLLATSHTRHCLLAMSRTKQNALQFSQLILEGLFLLLLLHQILRCCFCSKRFHDLALFVLLLLLEMGWPGLSFSPFSKFSFYYYKLYPESRLICSGVRTFEVMIIVSDRLHYHHENSQPNKNTLQENILKKVQ